MGSPKDVNLVASKSWEVGFTLFEGDINLSRNKQWGLTAGLGWGYTSFRVDGNSSFREIDGVTANHPAPEGISYDQSRLRYFYFRIPVSIEWQKRINGHHGRSPCSGPGILTRFPFDRYGQTFALRRTPTRHRPASERSSPIT